MMSELFFPLSCCRRDKGYYNKFRTRASWCCPVPSSGLVGCCAHTEPPARFPGTWDDSRTAAEPHAALRHSGSLRT